MTTRSSRIVIDDVDQLPPPSPLDAQVWQLILQGRNDDVKALVESGQYTDYDLALAGASYSNDGPLVAYFIQKGATDISTAMVYAAWGGNIRMMISLLNRLKIGQPEDVEATLIVAMRRTQTEHPDIYHYLGEDLSVWRQFKGQYKGKFKGQAGGSSNSQLSSAVSSSVVSSSTSSSGNSSTSSSYGSDYNSSYNSSRNSGYGSSPDLANIMSNYSQSPTSRSHLSDGVIGASTLAGTSNLGASNLGASNLGASSFDDTWSTGPSRTEGSRQHGSRQHGSRAEGSTSQALRSEAPPQRDIINDIINSLNRLLNPNAA